MATRKDLLKAQTFTERRMVAAFVDRDPDDPTPPLRRVTMATFVSILLGVILCAGIALLGLIGKRVGGDSWRSNGVIVSDTQAGMLFVYSESDEVLVPMADVASARLKAGGPEADSEPRVVKVTSKDLHKAKQVTMEGIPGAPRQLPATENMAGYPIRMCSSKPNPKGERFLTLEFAAPQVSVNQASFVARSSDNIDYLIANGRAHRLWSRQGQTSPLVENLPVVTAGDAWLTAIPQGPPIDRLGIENLRSTPSGLNPLNLTIGQTVQVENVEGPNTYYVQLDNGLARIGYLDMRLLMEAEGMPRPQVISESQRASAMNPDIQDITTAGLYDQPKGPEGYESLAEVSVCATYTENQADRVVLTVDQATPELPGTVQRPDGRWFDRVVMEPLAGALLQNAHTTDQDKAASFLIVEGKSYPIPSLNARKVLGYGDVKPARVPGSLLELFPPGLPANTSLSYESIRTVDG